MSISICVPFYNAERYLPDMIRSVFAQTHDDWEFILVDDGSTDRSLEIARSIKDPRVHVVSDGRNLRQAARRNQIVRKAVSDLIVVMDADDIMFSNRLEIQKQFFDDPQINLVSSAVCVINDQNEIRAIRNDRGRHDVTPFGIVKHRYRLLQPAMAGRKQWFLENPYDEEILYADDFEMLFHASVKKTLTNEMVRICDEPLLFYREGAALTTKKIIASQNDVRRGFDKYGREGLGPFGNILFRGIWEIRAYVYRMAASCNLLHTLKMLRGRPIRDVSLLKKYHDELAKILQTSVPGMDDYLVEQNI